MRVSESTPTAWAVLVFASLTTSTWWTHTDLGDSRLHQAVSRHMAEDGTWLALPYLPDVHPRFFEHLPFGFWPFALVIRLFGEGALFPADVPPGASVLVVSPRQEWTTVAAFAVERRWSPWRLTELGSGLAPGGPSEARVAFVAEGAPVSGPDWREVGREGRWRLLRKP